MRRGGLGRQVKSIDAELMRYRLGKDRLETMLPCCLTVVVALKLQTFKFKKFSAGLARF